MGSPCIEGKHNFSNNIGYAIIWYLGRGEKHVTPLYNPSWENWNSSMPNVWVCAPCLGNIPRDLIKKEPHKNLSKIIFGITTSSIDAMEKIFLGEGKIMENYDEFRSTMKFISEHAMRKYLLNAYEEVMKEVHERRMEVDKEIRNR